MGPFGVDGRGRKDEDHVGEHVKENGLASSPPEPCSLHPKPELEITDLSVPSIPVPIPPLHTLLLDDSRMSCKPHLRLDLLVILSLTFTFVSITIGSVELG